MKLTKGYRSENNPLLNNNSIPYEEFKICGIHTANQIINAVGHQKMHKGEINTFCCMVNQSQMLCGQIWQECFNIGLQEKSEHISCFNCNTSPPATLQTWQQASDLSWYCTYIGSTMKEPYCLVNIICWAWAECWNNFKDLSCKTLFSYMAICFSR